MISPQQSILLPIFLPNACLLHTICLSHLQLQMTIYKWMLYNVTYQLLARVIYIDGSKRGHCVGCATVSENHFHQTLFLYSIFSAELQTIIGALDMIDRFPLPVSKWYIVTLSAIFSLQEVSPGNEILLSITSFIYKCKNVGHTTELCWLPTLVSLMCIEKADQLTKMALNTSSESPLTQVTDMIPVIS